MCRALGWRAVPLVGAGRVHPGAELGQITAIGLVLPISRLAAVLVYRYASLAVATADAYWLVERIGLD
jgi:hypothetical protein